MFNLPKSTEVKKVIPKNAFDQYTNTKQKKLFSDKVLRITWLNKLATDTTNLSGKDIKEIQVFEVALKEKSDIKNLLSIIDKSIPYPIIFIVRCEETYYLSTSVKHIHPTSQHTAVIDHTFISDWFNKGQASFTLALKNNLDWVYKNFFGQFNVEEDTTESLQQLITEQKKRDTVIKEIEHVRSAISRCRQFNKKVELNIRLKDLMLQLEGDAK